MSKRPAPFQLNELAASYFNGKTFYLKEDVELLIKARTMEADHDYELLKEDKAKEVGLLKTELAQANDEIAKLREKEVRGEEDDT